MDPDFASAHKADPSSIPTDGLVVVIPAHNDAARIALTVLAARELPGVRAVAVLEHGSTDSTRRVARDSGAEVPDSVEELARLAPLPLLVVAATRQHTVAATLALAAPVLAGEAELVLGVSATLRGDAAARLTRRALGRAGLVLPGVPTGEYCLSRAGFRASRPPAAGAGELAGIALDLLWAKGRVEPLVLEAPGPYRARGLRGRSEVARALRGRRTTGD